MARMSKEKNQEYQRKWYKENRELQIQRNRDNVRQKILIIRKYKADRGCSRCNEKHVACLQFHHTNPLEKDTEIGKIVRRNLSLENIMKEIEKCEILCANCHFKHHWEESISRGKKPEEIEEDLIE